MTEKRKSKGKQAIPYLLSTTLSLKTSGRYFYRFFDFRFNCCRNRDCYTERNVRINMTRQWHNIIIPNAILCRESGYIPKFQDAIDALNHAMKNGKTERSIAMWKQICRIPYDVKDMQTKKKTGFHRKTKECLSRYEALRLAKKLGCGVFYCTYSSCWHVGKAGC